MTFRFADPTAFILFLVLPVILIVRRINQSRKLHVGYSTVKTLAGIKSAVSTRPVRIPVTIRLIAIVLLILAAARPQSGEKRDIVYSRGIDIVIALDISGSMRAVDFRPLNRFEMAKQVISAFIDARQHDRIGLVLFGGEAFTACPLTLDHELLKTILDQSYIGMVEEQTAIGKAIAVALNRLRVESENTSITQTEKQRESDYDKVIILATDGANNVFTGMDPMTAARAAQSMNIRIYTIGVGQEGMSPFPHPRIPGRYIQIPADLDEDALREIASITGGEYFRAQNTEALKRIFDVIDQMEKRPIESYSYIRYSELFYWFLIPAFVLFLTEIVLKNTVYRRFP